MQPDRRFICLADVGDEPVRWLWPERIPLGDISLLEGDAGCGKSALAYDLAARITRGNPLPGSLCTSAPAGVVLLQAEDGLAARVKPSLQAAGGEISRVMVYDRSQFDERPLVIPNDIPLIESAVGAIGAQLVVIDPLTSFLPNTSSEQAVRQALTPLARFAARAGVAILLVRHLNKACSAPALYRGAGSIAIVAAARSALRAAQDPASDDPHRHVLVSLKSNLSAPPGLAYRTIKSGERIRVEWLGEIACTTRDVAGEGDSSKLGEAMWILYSILQQGPLPAREVQRLAGDAGLPKRTLDRAKQAMGVAVRKQNGVPHGPWTWELPDDPSPLRPAMERDCAERLRQIRREVVESRPGDRWTAPAQDQDLYRTALQERGLVVVAVGAENRLLREMDVPRVPLLLELLAAASAADAGAEAAFRDLLSELGIASW